MAHTEKQLIKSLLSRIRVAETKIVKYEDTEIDHTKFIAQIKPLANKIEKWNKRLVKLGYEFNR